MLFFSIFLSEFLIGASRLNQKQVSLEKLTSNLLFGEKYINERFSPRISQQKVLSVIKSGSGLNSNDLAKRGESLIRHSTNRYLTTVRIAFRAKQRRFDDFDGLLEESTVKPVQRSIIELSDEQDQPDLLPG